MIWIVPDNPSRFENWHSWFAWHPVTVGNAIVWLQRVERKGTFNRGWGDEFWSWEYRLCEACDAS